MWHALVTSMVLVMAAPPRVEKASEAGGTLAPTRVRLDVRNKTLAEIVDGINAQGSEMLGVLAEPRISLPGARSTAPEPRYSLRAPGPVTFWEAIDRVGRATQTFPMSGNLLSRKLGVLLQPASADRGFACNDGAFRIIVTGMYSRSNFVFTPYFYNQPGVEQPKTDGSSRHPALSATLLIMAEPRLRIVHPVELVVREAVDDRGRSLIPAVPWRQVLSQGSARSYPNQEFVGVPLTLMDDPGQRIKHLAGSIIVEAADGRGGSPGAMVEVGFDFADIPLL